MAKIYKLNDVKRAKQVVSLMPKCLKELDDSRTKLLKYKNFLMVEFAIESLEQAIVELNMHYLSNKNVLENNGMMEEIGEE